MVKGFMVFRRKKLQFVSLSDRILDTVIDFYVLSITYYKTFFWQHLKEASVFHQIKLRYEVKRGKD